MLLASGEGCAFSEAADSKGLEKPTDLLRKASPSNRTFEALFGPNTDYEYFEGAQAFPFRVGTITFERVNAWWLAEAAMLVYVNDSDFIRDQFRRAGLEQVSIFSSPAESTHHTQGLIAHNDALVIVALRGTEPDEPKDILTDVNFVQVGANDGGRVHLGFKAALDDIWAALEEELDRLDDGRRTIWFTGHSLGAALAVLAADRYGRAAGVYTFGSPRVGDAEFRSRYRTPTYRLVNNVDAVTELPPAGFYFHVGELKYFDSDHRLWEGIRAFAWLQDRAKGRMDAVMSQLGEWTDLRFEPIPLKDVEDHAPIYYVIHCWNSLIEAE